MNVKDVFDIAVGSARQTGAIEPFITVDEIVNSRQVARNGLLCYKRVSHHVGKGYYELLILPYRNTNICLLKGFDEGDKTRVHVHCQRHIVNELRQLKLYGDDNEMNGIFETDVEGLKRIIGYKNEIPNLHEQLEIGVQDFTVLEHSEGKGQNAMKDEKNLVWMDMEMTGLDPLSDRILQIAVVITDSDLNILAQSPEVVIHQDKEVLDAMIPWCIDTHGKSGLTAKSLASEISVFQAQAIILEFLSRWVPKRCSPLCGNSIYQDRRFLAQHMPLLNEYLHYRLLDVSAIKICASMWRPDVAKQVVKQRRHTALEDIQESIDELKLYRNAFFGTRMSGGL